jgi:hypothetical protein
MDRSATNDTMQSYRFYTLTEEGHVAGPARNYELPDDAAAVKRAKLIIHEQAIQVWQGARIVASVAPDQD